MLDLAAGSAHDVGRDAALGLGDLLAVGVENLVARVGEHEAALLAVEGDERETFAFARVAAALLPCDEHGAAVERRDTGVGGLLVVVGEVAAAAESHAQGAVESEGPAGEVERVHRVIAELAVAPVPEPVPVVVDDVVAVGAFRRGALPEIVIEPLRHGRFFPAADRWAETGVIAAGGQHAADHAGFHGLDGGDDVRHAAALVAHLDAPPVMAGGPDDHLGLPRVVAGRLLDVDVFAGGAGHDGGGCVPVVWRGDGEDIQLPVLENLANVLGGLRRAARRFLHLGGRAGEHAAIHVADPGDFDIRLRGPSADVRASTIVEPHDGHPQQPRRRGAGKDGRSGGEGSGAQRGEGSNKRAAVEFSVHGSYFSRTRCRMKDLTVVGLWCGVCAFGLVLAAEEPTLRIGLIGLDTSHVVAFTKTLNDPSASDHVPGARVVAAFKGGSPDIPASRDRVEKFTEELTNKWGVVLVPTIEDLCRQVDAIILTSVDGRVHLEQARPVIAAGKRMFIDKPMAASLRDGLAIFELARERGVPVFSCSSLRYGTNTQAVRNGAIGRVLSAETESPMNIEPTHPELFWYGIHGVESLFTVMGPGCRSVRRRVLEDGRVEVVGTWADGRTGVYRQSKGNQGYGGVARGERGEHPIGTSSGYAPMLREVVKFFRTGVPPVPEQETIEILAFMEASELSRERGGAEVELSEVIERARKAVPEATGRR